MPIKWVIGSFLYKKVKDKLVVRHKFEKSSEFNMLMYRLKPLKKKCADPLNPKNGCTSM